MLGKLGALSALERKGMNEARNGAAITFPKLDWVAMKV